MTPYPFIAQGDNITIVIDSQPHTISKTHITYPQVLAAIKAGDWQLVKEIVDPVKVVLKFGQGNVTIEGETLYWKNKVLHSSLATRMISMLQEGFSIEPMVLFMENLFSNPSHRAVSELYSFLEKNNLPITPDGHFLAYKRVRENYFDCYTGTMDNSVGKIVEMERNAVDDDKDRTCSTGLHFCSHSYLGHFGGDRVVIVKINPRDVVSIPSDYNDAKGRACRYEVIGEVENNPDDGVEFNRSVQSNAWSAMADDAHAEWELDGGDDDIDTDDCWFEDDEDDEDGPDVGNSSFHRGYTDAFESNGISSTWVSDPEYLRGYALGSDDAREYNDAKFEFDSTLTAPDVPLGWVRHPDGRVSPPTGTVFTAQSGPDVAWPFPTGAK